LFLNVSDFETEKKSKSTLSKEQNDLIVELYRNRGDVDGVSRCVSYEELKENNFDLSALRYVKHIEVVDDEPIADVHGRQKKLELEFNFLVEEMQRLTSGLINSK